MFNNSVNDQKHSIVIKKVSVEKVLEKANFIRSNKNSILNEVDRVCRETTTIDRNSVLFQNEYAPLIATICDQHVKADHAWMFPDWLNRKLSGLSAEKLIEIGEYGLRKYLEEYFKDKWPKNMKDYVRKRYLENIPKYIIDSIKFLKNKGVSPVTMFENREYSAAEVYFILRQFKGIGPKKALMITRDFLYDSIHETVDNPWYSQIKNKRSEFKISGYVFPPIDVHVAKVFYRLFGGKYDVDWRELLSNNSFIQDIIMFSILTFPKLPAEIDEVFWNIGRCFCGNPPKCHECPLNKVCDYFN